MAASQPQAGGRRDSVHCSSSSIRASKLKDLKVQQHLHLNGDEHGMEDANPVLQKLQKWADYPSYGTSVAATKFLPMKVPSVPLACVHAQYAGACPSLTSASITLRAVTK